MIEHDTEVPSSGMSGTHVRLARRIAIAAAREGLIAPHVLWDLAAHATLGGADSVRELFDGVLDARQLARFGGGEVLAERLDLADTLRQTPPPSSAPRARAAPAVGDETARAQAVAPEARYELGVELGVGGSGRVIRARDRQTSRIVALKTMRRQSEGDAELRERFEAEARMTAQLEHPCIVPVYDIGVLADGRPFYTMPVVKQESLRDVLLARGVRSDWSLSRLVSVLVQVCRALFYVHERRILHHDIKPENVLVGDYGEVYLADWGAATRIAAEGGVFQDAPLGTSGLTGTPGYIAPERIRGEPHVDQRADLFALGVVLYEVLTGRHPFEGASADEVLLATLKRAPRAPGAVVGADCPVALEALCLALLEKHPLRRPRSAEQVAAALTRYLDDNGRGRGAGRA